jgi:DNA polymerase III subunit delta'
MGFDGIVGHGKQKEMLLSALTSERLPHAFLFSGQEGIGKKRTAREFAKYILCDDHSACGTCRPCSKIDRGSHPDVLIIENNDSIGIEQSRTIGKEISEYPYESDRRVILIDGVDTMTHEAANALLKTLEEPPPYNVFFLITSSERDVPLTIRSRCAKINFSPLPRESLKQYFLKKGCMDEDKAELLSRISEGSIGCGFFWSDKETLLLRRKIAELVLGKKRGFLQVTSISERMTDSPRELMMYLSFLLSLFRDISTVAEYGETSLVVNRDVKDLLEGQRLDVKWVEGSVAKIRETFRILRYNISKLMAVENLFIHITEQA